MEATAQNAAISVGTPCSNPALPQPAWQLASSPFPEIDDGSRGPSSRWALSRVSAVLRRRGLRTGRGDSAMCRTGAGPGSHQHFQRSEPGRFQRAVLRPSAKPEAVADCRWTTTRLAWTSTALLVGVLQRARRPGPWPDDPQPARRLVLRPSMPPLVERLARGPPAGHRRQRPLPALRPLSGARPCSGG